MVRLIELDRHRIGPVMVVTAADPGVRRVPYSLPWNTTSTIAAATNGEYNHDYAGQDPINDYDLAGTFCFSCLLHSVKEDLISTAPIGAGILVGGLGTVACLGDPVCGVVGGSLAAGLTSGLLARYRNHESALQSARKGLLDASFSLLTDGILHIGDSLSVKLGPAWADASLQARRQAAALVAAEILHAYEATG